ncbi:MAG: hypothetical protein Q4C65_11020 [Eubacteriales bacterium]|nr:hypothetical protein [Eubacteriales bacterium]
MRTEKIIRKLACLAVLLAGLAAAGKTVQAQEAGSVTVPMPGFAVEQWSAPKRMQVNTASAVSFLPDPASGQIGAVEAGQQINVWGQTDTGWYFVECGQTLGYVSCAAAAPAVQPAVPGSEAQPSVVPAGIVFIGDSRMVTLREAVENNLGPCLAAVIAKNGSRYEWFHDTAIPQADKIIGSGSRVVINMGVNDLADADKYARDVNAWAAVWTARGAQVYYASVNPVWANSHGITQERVDLFNSRLKPQLIPQVIWLDSSAYLMSVGVHSNDGLHYRDDTNLNLYHYYLAMIGAL